MATPGSWWMRLLRALRLSSDPKEPGFSAGADYGQGVQSSNPYPTLYSLSAFGSFPWVVSCASVVAEDLSGLPLRLTKGDGPDAERIESHPVLDLLARPTSWQARRAWERQMVIFWLLSGDAYSLMLGVGGPATGRDQPSSLPLLHPMRVTVLSGAFGGPTAYRYNGAGEVVDYPADSVLHWTAPSWEDGPVSLLGQGAIRALANDLSGELAASRLWANQAQRGRPDVIISPSEPGVTWDGDVRKAILDAYDGMVAKKRALVIGGAAKIETTSLTLRDMEFQEGRRYTRETILAAFGVPPTKVGLPSANYATAKEEDRKHWQRLVARAAIIDDELTRLAKRWDPTFTIRHDFSEVPALQESRSDRQARVQTWWMMGVPLEDAAAYEGFADLPESVRKPEPSSGETPKGLLSFFPDQRPVLREVKPEDEEQPRTGPKTEAARHALWRSMMDRVQVPAERHLNVAMVRFLRAQSVRVSDALGRALVEEGIEEAVVRETPASVLLPADIEALLARIFDESAEARALEDAARPLIERAVLAAFDLGTDLVGADLVWDPTRIDQGVEDQIGALITFVSSSTKEQVRAVLQKGYAEGQTLAELQWAIQHDQGFSPTRALLIARTETTRSMSAGTLAAYNQALAEGVQVKKQWLSSRDSSTRPSHLALDGQTVSVGAPFVVPATGNGVISDPVDIGATGAGPGQFAHPGMVCNCRCTTIPIVEEAS